MLPHIGLSQRTLACYRFLQLTEAGTTPVLKANEDDKVFTDSAEIMKYLDEKIASPHLGDAADMPERQAQYRTVCRRPGMASSLTVCAAA